MPYSWTETLLVFLLITAFQWVCLYATLFVFCSSSKRKISKADRGELYSQRSVNDAAVVGTSMEDFKSREPEDKTSRSISKSISDKKTGVRPMASRVRSAPGLEATTGILITDHFILF